MLNRMLCSILRLATPAGVFCAWALVASAQITETTRTVDPKGLLIEVDALSLTVDRDGSERYTALAAGSTLVSKGLTSTWDVQVGFNFFITQKIESRNFTDRNTGIGDVFFRTKWRFFEDEETNTSVAVIPYFKVPTNSGGVGNDSVEGGVIVPWESELVGGLSLRTMAKLDVLRNADDNGYDTFWYTSAALGWSLTRFLGLYGEVEVGKSTGDGGWRGTMGAGATLSISKGTRWDVAVYRGISSAAADWNPVVRVNFEF